MVPVTKPAWMLVELVGNLKRELMMGAVGQAA